jgi:hypothetical protein
MLLARLALSTRPIALASIATALHLECAARIATIASENLLHEEHCFVAHGDRHHESRAAASSALLTLSFFFSRQHELGR